ncbi:MAG: translation initiation factor IF-2, partial [Parachlamydiaceae bacterium]
SHHKLLQPKTHTFLKDLPVREKFGPTGKHVKDLIPPKKPAPVPGHARDASRGPAPHREGFRDGPGFRPREGGPAREGGAPYRGPRGPGDRPYPPRSGAPAPRGPTPPQPVTETSEKDKKSAKFREYRDVKPTKKTEASKFDSRDRQGLSAGDDDSRWRKRKAAKHVKEEDNTIRPTALKVRLPILLKDLASEMKLKASQLVQKLFMQGVIVTLNSILDDETTVQLLGQEFGCTITIDTTKEDKIRITDRSIQQEIKETDTGRLKIRPPVVAFMGHVDHGKTSLIDFIRKSNRASDEAGAITQHIGAFMCKTAVGEIAILDTPGHEAFSAMRARGANVTDIVVLVVAGDEGIRQQTIEAIQHAKAAGVIIVVAINKCDKPNFNAENVYRQLSEQELLPEAWGGQTITVNCSAVTGEGVKELLEMLALQAEVLELKADPNARARGRVIESELNKGHGAKATVLVLNGTLKKGDSLVFESYWGRVKTMFDENGKEIESAGPSHPVEITGLSGLPDAGQEFIVVPSEKEAKEISGMRTEGIRQLNLLQKKKLSMENLLTQAENGKKILNIVLRADVQGSLEALKVAL